MRLALIFIFLFFSSHITFGQIIERTEDRAKQKAKRRVDNKIDQGIDKGLDAIEGIFKKKNKPEKAKEKPATTQESQTNNSDAFSKMFGSGDVQVKDSYTYDQSILLSVQTFSSSGKPSDEVEMKMYFSDKEPSIGMEISTQGTSLMIYDFDAHQMVTLIDNAGQKMGMAMKLDPNVLEEEGQKDTSGAYTFVKTGQSKTISGYNCQEYKVESSTPNTDDSEVHFWVTKDINTDWMMNFSNAMNSNKSMTQSYKLPAGYPDGSVIQVIALSKKSKEKSVTTVKEFKNNDKKTISTKGYQMMSMPGGN